MDHNFNENTDTTVIYSDMLGLESGHKIEGQTNFLRRQMTKAANFSGKGQ